MSNANPLVRLNFTLAHQSHLAEMDKVNVCVGGSKFGN